VLKPYSHPSEWRSNFTADNYRPGTLARTTIERIFPDVDKMPIASRLKEWGIDVKKMTVIVNNDRGTLAAVVPSQHGPVYLEVSTHLQETHPGEKVYLVLAHEFAHLLQIAEDRIEWGKGYNTMRSWLNQSHETDAIRWAARQAMAMGMSKKEYYEAEDSGSHMVVEARIISEPVFRGTWPEDRGVRPIIMGGKPYVERVLVKRGKKTEKEKLKDGDGSLSVRPLFRRARHG
jgi:hypothetical protein